MARNGNVDLWLIGREVFGWILILVGLFLIYLLVRLVYDRAILEAFALSFPATIVFRSGIGMVRLATAARIAKGLRREALQELGVTRRIGR